MSTDRLSEKFASLRLASPSPPTTPTTTPTTTTTATLPLASSRLSTDTFNIVDAPKSTTNVLDAYRLYMNPQDLIALRLEADTLVTLNGGLVCPVWPSLPVPARCVRISSWLLHAAQIKESTVTVSPYLGKCAIPKKCTFICNTPLRKSERDMLRVQLGILPTMQVGREYQLVQSNNPAKPITFHLQRVLDEEEESVYIPATMQRSIEIFIESPPQQVTLSTEQVSTRLSPPPLHDQILGGLDRELEQICRAIELALKYGNLLTKYHVRPPKGILLYGPPGTGKTLLARTVARQLNLHAIFVDGAEFMGRYCGESESRLREIFSQASMHGPSLIFFDEIDALCPKRDQSLSASDIRLVSTLLTLMDGISLMAKEVSKSDDTLHMETRIQTQHSPLFILAATNSPNSIDPALRRPGRFDYEIEIPMPTNKQRQQILEALLRQLPSRASQETINKIAADAHGFVGADLALICKEASLLAMQRSGDFYLGDQEMLQAFIRTKPSALREIALQVPKVYWEDIGGQHLTRQKLLESIEWPLKHPDRFLRMGIKPPKGVLLYGPPGCSKTLLAKALATESALNFLAVKGPELFSKWVGESEKAIHEIFRKARLAAPSIIFFDEFDAIGARRGDASSGNSVSERVLSQLLSEMDGIEPLTNVTIIAATNRPDIIDTALLRPGRFDRHIYVSLPDLIARHEILRIHGRKMAFDPTLDLEQLAKQTEGFSGAELTALSQEAARTALRQDFTTDKITMDHFLLALKVVTPQTPSSMLRLFERFTERNRH